MTKEEEAIKILSDSNILFNIQRDTALSIRVAIETVLNMLKENSAEIEQKNTELAEKSAEIERYKSLYNKALEDLVKADRENIENKKVIDLMVKAMNKIQDPQVCKYCDNNTNLNNGYCTDAKKCKDGIKKYFERKVKK